MRTRIETLKDLLERLYVDRVHGTKTRAYILKDEYYENFNALVTEFTVREHFDDGKGHSNALTSDETSFDQSLFDEALRNHYIEQIPKLGHMSDREFRLSKNGKDKLFELQSGTDKTSNSSS